MGLTAAVELAKRGLTVVGTMRDPARATGLRQAAEKAGVEVDVRALDVTDLDAVRQCTADVLREYGRIDLLVNNAGRGAVATAEQLTMQDVQDQLDVNYLGPVALTKEMLPIMRVAGRGRVLTVTSVGGAVGQPFADAYCGAKFAVEGFMQSLAPVAERFGVWVSVVEPAAVASDFVDNVLRSTDSETSPYADLESAYLARTAGAFKNAQSAQSAGEAIADAATSGTYRFRYQTSPQASAFAGMSLADLDGQKVLDATRTWLG